MEEVWVVSKRPIACDTTVLLYLGRVDQISLIPALLAPVYVPEQVILELDMGRVLRPDTANPRSFGWATSVSVSRAAIGALPPNRLGLGEQAVVAYADTHQGFLAGLDDLQARRLAEALGLTPIAPPGIIGRVSL